MANSPDQYNSKIQPPTIFLLDPPMDKLDDSDDKLLKLLQPYDSPRKISPQGKLVQD